MYNGEYVIGPSGVAILEMYEVEFLRWIVRARSRPYLLKKTRHSVYHCKNVCDRSDLLSNLIDFSECRRLTLGFM